MFSAAHGKLFAAGHHVSASISPGRQWLKKAICRKQQRSSSWVYTSSELVFPEGLEHEDFTDKIIINTEIADYINEIGSNYVKKYGQEYNITLI